MTIAVRSVTAASSASSSTRQDAPSATSGTETRVAPASATAAP